MAVVRLEKDVTPREFARAIEEICFPRLSERDEWLRKANPEEVMARHFETHGTRMRLSRADALCRQARAMAVLIEEARSRGFLWRHSSMQGGVGMKHPGPPLIIPDGDSLDRYTGFNPKGVWRATYVSPARATLYFVRTDEDRGELTFMPGWGSDGYLEDPYYRVWRNTAALVGANNYGGLPS